MKLRIVLGFTLMAAVHAQNGVGVGAGAPPAPKPPAAAVPGNGAPAPKGAIRGVVKDLVTGQPVAEGSIFVTQPPARPAQATTDAQGRFSVSNIEPGRVQITARGPMVQGAGIPQAVTKYVTIAAGQTVEGIELPLAPNAEISGKLVDQNDEPMPGLYVMLVAREYQMGELHYVMTSLARADDQGHYQIQRVTPGRAYFLVAMKRENSAPKDAISDSPADPKLRRAAVVPTYYPGNDRIEGAQLLTLRPGEKRTNVDLRLLRSPAYCMEGSLQAAGGAGPLQFEYSDAWPRSGWAGSSGLFVSSEHGTTGADGKVRICDLHPGQYRFFITQRGPELNGPPPYFATALATVTDRDTTIAVTAQARMTVPAEIVWADTPLPASGTPLSWSLELRPVARTQFRGESTFVTREDVGPFVLETLFLDDYRMMPRTVPNGAYVKDITYGDKSVLYAPFHPGSVVGSGTLRVVVAHDGGMIAAKVQDKDGNAISDQQVIALPASVRSEAELADRAVSGQTDQNGAWTSAMLAPGKYYVLTLGTPFDASPETVGKIWAARSRAAEVEIGPGRTVDVRIAPAD